MFLRGDALLMKIVIATIEERQRIRFAIELGEVKLLEAGRAIVMLFTLARSPGNREGGYRRPLLL